MSMLADHLLYMCLSFSASSVNANLLRIMCTVNMFQKKHFTVKYYTITWIVIAMPVLVDDLSLVLP